MRIAPNQNPVITGRRGFINDANPRSESHKEHIGTTAITPYISSSRRNADKFDTRISGIRKSFREQSDRDDVFLEY